MTYSMGDRVVFTYRDFDLVTDEYKGTITVIAKVTRIWPNQKTITIRTADGKTFMRNVNSPDVRKD